MSGEVRFEMDPAFEAGIAADPETKAVIKDFADRALEGARAAVPVRTGRTRESYFADEDGLGSTSSFWALIEYGDVHNPPYAPLRKGVESAGLVMRDDE